MKNNWIIDEALKADGSRGYVILEDPDSKKQLDDLLVKRFWPFIRSRLRDASYSFHKKRSPTEFELSHSHERSLTFMLFDNRVPFFRGTLKCSRESWMVESEFFLLLKKDHDPRILFELLGNSRLCGMPPELSVHKGNKYYFQIMFRNGKGASWGPREEEPVKKRIDKVIQVNVDMYEISRRGTIPQSMMGQFLSTAYEVYEAY